MSWKPISSTVPQYHVSGSPASGYYLKAYQAGTTTAVNMATDTSGGTTLAKVQINSEGYPINGSSAVFIPHIGISKYKLAFYLNATDADNDTTGSAAWVVDNISIDLPNTTSYELGSVAAAQSHPGISTGHLITTNYHDTNRVANSGASFRFTGTTTAGNAGNWPHTDGYFYDADGKQFAIVGSAVVQAFGARGDGTTNDQAAIQNAIEAGQEYAGVIDLNTPDSFYRLESTLTIDKPCSLVGDNAQGTVLYAVGNAGYMIDIDGTVNANLEGVKLEGFTLRDSSGTADLVHVNRVSNSVFRDIFLYGGIDGFVIDNNRTFSNLFDRVIVVSSLTGSVIYFDGYTGGGQMTFSHCSFGGNRGVFVDSDSSITSIGFDNCNFESCSAEAVYVNGSVHGLGIDTCRFEANNGSSTILIDPATAEPDQVRGLRIVGCEFDNGTGDRAIQFGGSGGDVTGFEIAGNSFRDYSTNDIIRLNGEGETGRITDNYIASSQHIVNAIRPNMVVERNYNSAGSLDLQVLSGAGAVDVLSRTTHVITTGTNALTLADGAEGQQKTLVMITDAGDGTLTPSNLANGTTITFDDVGDSAELFFTNSAWHFMGGTATLA